MTTGTKILIGVGAFLFISRGRTVASPAAVPSGVMPMIPGATPALALDSPEINAHIGAAPPVFQNYIPMSGSPANISVGASNPLPNFEGGPTMQASLTPSAAATLDLSQDNIMVPGIGMESFSPGTPPDVKLAILKSQGYQPGVSSGPIRSVAL